MRRIHVIACAVLKLDLEEAARKLGVEIGLQLLPAGLHRQPHELRRRLQDAIDEASTNSVADLIAVGYGVCGTGTVGIHARAIPLAIPRVHDCIALFLGSDASYREQFAAYPGTYYISAGWVEGRSQPQLSSDDDPAKRGPTDADFQQFLLKYGEENTRAIREFLTSWQRNYQRAAFIDTGVSGKSRKYADIAQDMAREFGWKYEHIAGSIDLLKSLLRQEKSDDGILIVPPHHTTVYESTGKKLKAIPAWEPQSQEADRTIVIEEDQKIDRPDTAQLGLGIDAGGTYTDVVIFDFRHDRVVQKAKAFTTKWNYSIGIEKALAQLDASLLAEVNLVSVSTTLATNAIVEGRGQDVGLLVMPPYGWKDLSKFKHRPIAIVDGKMEIDGREIAPIDPDQVRNAVRMMLKKHTVKAFAAAGFASHSNPSHELAIKRIIVEETGFPVTCGYEVSEGLNYRVRAETAALNARIIPCLQALLDRVRSCLKNRHIDAPLMVVKSDGSLTSIDSALERPIETLLSGPAASVAGARHLTSVQNASVVDMGGTTSDVAVIRNGVVETFEEGAVVGGWQTHVRALDMRTLGLGGDSHIGIEKGQLCIGPQRVAPVSWLAAYNENTAGALAWIEHHIDYYATSTKGMEVVSLNGSHTESAFSVEEQSIIKVLEAGPRSLDELCRRVNNVVWQLLPLKRLEEQHVIQRSALTPTDLMHCTGRMSLWDVDASKKLCAIYSRILHLDPEEFTDRVVHEVERRLAVELLKKQLDETHHGNDLEASPAAMDLIHRALTGDGDGFRVRISLRDPVVGIGAPAHQFLPAAVKLLNGEAIIPPDADVANALGAITSVVTIHKRVTIAVDEKGVFHLKGLPDAPTFTDLQDAQDHAIEELKRDVREMAAKAGTSQTKIEIVVGDTIGTVADGSGIFLGRNLEARLSGLPDLVRLT